MTSCVGAPACDPRSPPAAKERILNYQSRSPGGRPAPQASPGRGEKAADADKVLKAFNTWAFKREQPSDRDLMLDVIQAALAAEKPLPFVLYWGKGPRDRIGAPEIACLDYLDALALRVRSAYPAGAAIMLICTDTHARLNGHSARSIADYFGDVRQAARERGFDACWLGKLAPPDEPAPAHDVAGACVSEDILRRLSACATKWYRGDGAIEDGALKYFWMNMLEKRAVEQAFPGSIFVTFNGSELRCLFPSRLPIFYMYSLRRGVSVKPWFMSDDAAGRDAHAPEAPSPSVGREAAGDGLAA